MPPRIRALPVDRRGFPVPWFVAKINDEWDFRVIGPGKFATALRQRRCWVCGVPLGRFKAFPIGPMCAVNRITAEPPSHLACAEFAAQACPFLTQPRARRNERDLPPEGVDPPGVFLKRNPGVTCIWICERFRVTQERLINLGPPTAVTWWAHGRRASKAEVEEAFASGVPALRAAGDLEITEEAKVAAHRAIDAALVEARKLWPAAAMMGGP